MRLQAPALSPGLTTTVPPHAKAYAFIMSGICARRKSVRDGLLRGSVWSIKRTVRAREDEEERETQKHNTNKSFTHT